MNRDKKMLYAISTISFAILLVILALTAKNSKIITAVAMALIAPVIFVLIKKRGALSISKREALLLTTVLAALYVIMILIAGTFVTSYKNPYFVNGERLLTQILPLVVIIVGSEIVRYVLLCQKDKYASAMSWLICVLAEVLMFSGIATPYRSAVKRTIDSLIFSQAESRSSFGPPKG